MDLPPCPVKEPPAIRFRKQQAWLAKNAIPRVIPHRPPIKRGPKFSNDTRLEELAKPLHVFLHPLKDPNSYEYRFKHGVPKSTLSYVATARIEELARPRSIWKKYVERKIPRSALAYEPTARITELSLPRIPYKKFKPKRPVSKKALKYKASEKIIQLAVPRDRKVEINEFAYSVVPAALTAGCTKRTRKLAKGKALFTQEAFDKVIKKQQERKIVYDKKNPLAKLRKKVLQRARQAASAKAAQKDAAQKDTAQKDTEKKP